jgi:hypothetical protein
LTRFHASVGLQLELRIPSIAKQKIGVRALMKKIPVSEQKPAAASRMATAAAVPPLLPAQAPAFWTPNYKKATTLLSCKLKAVLRTC